MQQTKTDLTPLLHVVGVGALKATLPNQKNCSMQSRRLIFFFSLVGPWRQRPLLQQQKCNKQTASTLFNVVGLGTQLGLFPPKKWHHFLGGKSCSQAPRPTTLKRVDAVCLLHFCCCRRGRRCQGPTSKKETTTLPGTVASLTMTTTSSFSCCFPFLPWLSWLVQ